MDGCYIVHYLPALLSNTVDEKCCCPIDIVDFVVSPILDVYLVVYVWFQWFADSCANLKVNDVDCSHEGEYLLVFRTQHGKAECRAKLTIQGGY